MDIFVQIVLLALGLALVVKGADFLVEGAGAIARRFGVSEFVIGLTIVGFGTSCPELVVSLTGAIKGLPDVAAGNVIGSNIFNIMLILGLTAVICPVPIQPKNRHFDLPVLIGATALAVLLGVSDKWLAPGSGYAISRVDGAVLLVAFVAYVWWCFKSDRDKTAAAHSRPEQPEAKKTWLSAMLCAGGLAGLVFGGRMFVDSATALARAAGLSEKFIAITILALGTSLPELVTSIVAARKKQIQLALGNVMGSNIFNILFILGVSALIQPVSVASMDLVDVAALLGAPLLIVFSCLTQRDNTVSRTDGAMLLVMQLAYIAYLIYKI